MVHIIRSNIGISALVVSSTSLQKQNYEPIFILIPIGLVVLSIVLFRRLGKVKRNLLSENGLKQEKMKSMK